MNKKKVLIAAAAILLTAVLYWLIFSGVTPQDIQSIVEKAGPWAPAAYVGLFALLPAFFFPVAVLALAGGLLFGLGLGSLYTFIGAIINCALMFLLSRYVGRAQAERFIANKLSPYWQDKLSKAGGKEGFLLLVILRLIPAVPYNLINYTYGLTPMAFRPYMLGSALGIIPGTLVFINIGDKAWDITSPSFWLAIVMLVLLLAVTAFLGKRLFPNNEKTNGDKQTNGTEENQQEP